MPDPWSAKLSLAGSLDSGERSALARIAREAFDVAAHHDLIREGDPPRGVHLIVDGFVCRYKRVRSGRRRITAWMLPGDHCPPQVGLLGRMDHSIGTLTAARVAFVPTRVIEALSERHPNLRRALAWNSLVDEAILRVWLANATLMTADRRIGYFLCELQARLYAIGRAPSASFDLSVGQACIGETVGLSTEHVNRTLARLAARGLVHPGLRGLVVPQIEALQAFVGFDPGYLHLSAATLLT